jgi:hypothetical protein
LLLPQEGNSESDIGTEREEVESPSTKRFIQVSISGSEKDESLKANSMGTASGDKSSTEVTNELAEFLDRSPPFLPECPKPLGKLGWDRPLGSIDSVCVELCTAAMSCRQQKSRKQKFKRVGRIAREVRNASATARRVRLSGLSLNGLGNPACG